MKLPPDVERKCLELAGLVPEAVPLAHGTPKRRPKPKLVEASFTPPATWVIPLAVYPGDNARVGKQSRIGRSGHERRVTTRSLWRGMVTLYGWAAWIDAGKTCTVTLTRLGPRALDTDNLQASLKFVRDAISDVLGQDDACPLIRWEYQQRKSELYGVEVTIT